MKQKQIFNTLAIYQIINTRVRHIESIHVDTSANNCNHSKHLLRPTSPTQHDTVLRTRHNQTLIPAKKQYTCMCLAVYSAVSNPRDRSKRLIVYFPERPVHSDTISEASSRMLQLMCEGCSYTYLPLSIARYSFIQLS